MSVQPGPNLGVPSPESLPGSPAGDLCPLGWLSPCFSPSLAAVYYSLTPPTPPPPTLTLAPTPGGHAAKAICETVKPVNGSKINHLNEKISQTHSLCVSVRLRRRFASLFRRGEFAPNHESRITIHESRSTNHDSQTDSRKLRAVLCSLVPLVPAFLFPCSLGPCST